jgi:hypothetical protein
VAFTWQDITSPEPPADGNEGVNVATDRYPYLGGCGQSGFGSNAAAQDDRMIVAEGAHKPVFVVGGTGELDLTLS